jgi:hypothetical protein
VHWAEFALGPDAQRGARPVACGSAHARGERWGDGSPEATGDGAGAATATGWRGDG